MASHFILKSALLLCKVTCPFCVSLWSLLEFIDLFFLFVVEFLLIILFSSIQIYIESVSQSRLWTCYKNSCGFGGGEGDSC